MQMQCSRPAPIADPRLVPNALLKSDSTSVATRTSAKFHPFIIVTVDVLDFNSCLSGPAKFSS